MKFKKFEIFLLVSMVIMAFIYFNNEDQFNRLKTAKEVYNYIKILLDIK